MEIKVNRLKSQKECLSANDPPLDDLNQLLDLYNGGKIKFALSRANKLTKNYPFSAVLHNVVGAIKAALGELDAAIEAYKTAIRIKPDFVEAQNNLGIALTNHGKLEDAIATFKTAITSNPQFAEAFYNMGKAYVDNANLKDAVHCYQHALKIKPEYAEAAFNLAATTNNVSDAKFWIKDCLRRNPQYLNAILHDSAIAMFEGDDAKYINLLESSLEKHPFTRSLTWVFELPKLPKLCFDRWAFFDNVIDLCTDDRPFYEFGVWRGKSFEYLIQKLGCGFGFDTFTGLPEDWHREKLGSYSSEGTIPQIAGGEFIVGKFENSLPNFFSRKRPLASLINFDADLYSSTLCALNFSKPVIDENTTLIFDEFIVSENWEEDEFKALTEFCQANNLVYEILAISFFSKQVALKLLGKPN